MNVFKRPMLYAAVICCVVASVSLYFKEFAYILLAIAILALLVCIFKKQYRYIVILSAVFFFGVNLTIQFCNISKIDLLDGKKIVGRFMVVEETVNHGNYNTVTIKEYNCDALPKGSRILLFDYQQENLTMGDIVNATLEIDSIDKFDKYRNSNYGDSVYATASTKKVEKTKQISLFYKTTGRIRNYVKQTVSSFSSGNTAGLLLALTTGDKDLLSGSFLANVKTTGISHIIVVSGMHLAIIMSAIFWCLDNLFYNKYIRTITATLVVISIVAICGFTMSVVRSAVMFLIAAFAPVLNHDNDSLNSIFAAITAVAIATPFAFFNISFQLSALSTLVIIWIVPVYYNIIVTRFCIKSKMLKTILGVSLSSIFAVIFTLPVTIKIFGYVSIISPITNLLITYPTTVALIANILALALSALPLGYFLSYPLFWISASLSKVIIYVVNNLAKMPITVMVLPKSSFWLSIALIFGVIGYSTLYEIKKKRRG